MQFAAKLEQLEKRYEELTGQMADPALIGDADQYRKVAKTQSELAEIVSKYPGVEEGGRQPVAGARDAAGSAIRRCRRWRRKKLARLEPERERIESDLKVLLLPKDPNDDKNVVLEIRAGRAATKLRCSPRRFSACTRATPRRRTGRWK